MAMDWGTISYLVVTLSHNHGGVACAIVGTCMATSITRIGMILHFDGFGVSCVRGV